MSGHTETPDPQWTLTPSTQNNDKWLDLDEASRPLVVEGEGVRDEAAVLKMKTCLMSEFTQCTHTHTHAHHVSPTGG